MPGGFLRHRFQRVPCWRPKEGGAELKGTRRDKFRLRCVHEVSYRSLGCRYAPIRPCALAHAGPGLARPMRHKLSSVCALQSLSLKLCPKGRSSKGAVHPYPSVPLAQAPVRDLLAVFSHIITAFTTAHCSLFTALKPKPSVSLLLPARP